MGEGQRGTELLRVIASGGLEIWCGDTQVDSSIPAKASLMIAYLADRGSPVSRATLAGLLWSDYPEELARTSLRVTLSRSRRHIPHLRADRSTVALMGEVSFDLHQIEAGESDVAMTLYQGGLLSGVEIDGAELFNDWLMRRGEEHRMLTLRLLASGAQQASDGERWADVRSIGRRMIEIEPWNEVAHRHVISASAVIEGRATALAEFDRCSAALLNEFGVPPEDETAASLPPRFGVGIRSAAAQLAPRRRASGPWPGGFSAT